jgi:hypothetical protein
MKMKQNETNIIMTSCDLQLTVCLIIQAVERLLGDASARPKAVVDASRAEVSLFTTI